MSGATLDIYRKIEENKGWKSPETVDAVGGKPTASQSVKEPRQRRGSFDIIKKRGNQEWMDGEKMAEEILWLRIWIP